jgi:hypothetical protein
MQYSVQSVLIVKCTSFAINWIYDLATINKTYWLLGVWLQRKIHITDTNILQF